MDGPYEATVALTLDCDEPETITVTATHNGDSSPVATVFCVPNLNDPHVTIEKQADGNDEYEFDWDTSGGDCLVIADDGTVDFNGGGSFDLEDNDEAEFFCESGVDLVIDEDDDADFVEVDCDEEDGVDISGDTVEFDIDDLDDTASCVWFNDEDLVATPTSVAGPAASVRIVLSATQINCGGSTLVQVLPRSSSGGPAGAGTTITLTSSLGGSFQPSGSITSGFPIALANFLYTAPDDASGVTTITARAGNALANANVSIVCGAAPVPTSTSAPLKPPSAGSGGLAGSSGGASAYLPSALAIAAAAVVLGVTLVSRRFAAATQDGGGFAAATAPESRRGGLALLASLVMLAVTLFTRRW